MQSMCNCPVESPFLWRTHLRASIFARGQEFGAWNGKSKSEICTEAKDRYEAQTGRQLAQGGAPLGRGGAA